VAKKLRKKKQQQLKQWRNKIKKIITPISICFRLFICYLNKHQKKKNLQKKIIFFLDMTSGNNSQAKRKEIYRYEAPWMVYAMNWSMRPDKRFRLALGSFVEEYNNKVQIVSLDEDKSEFVSRSTFDHPYPTTKVMWIPDTVTKLSKISIYLLLFVYRKVHFLIYLQQVVIIYVYGKQVIMSLD
jgi:hypothetical protein